MPFSIRGFIFQDEDGGSDIVSIHRSGISLIPSLQSQPYSDLLHSLKNADVY